MFNEFMGNKMFITHHYMKNVISPSQHNLVGTTDSILILV